MRNWLSLGIVGAVTLGLVGCGGGDRPASGGSLEPAPEVTRPAAPSPHSPNATTAPSGGTTKPDKAPSAVPGGAKLPTPPAVKVDIPKPGDKGWGKTSMTAATLAKNVNAAISRMAKTYGEANTFVRTPEGRARAQSLFRIQDSRTFRADFIASGLIPKTGVVLSNGKEKRRVVASESTMTAKVGTPLKDAKLTPEQVLSKWPREFSRLMFLPLTDGVDSWTPLLTRLQKGEGGFKTVIEERTLISYGKPVKNYRVRAARSETAAKKLGKCEIEMVIDAQRFLPVTVRVVSTDAQGKPWEQQWSGGWGFNRKFSPSDFEKI